MCTRKRARTALQPHPPAHAHAHADTARACYLSLTRFHRFDGRQYAYAGAINIQCTPACMARNHSIEAECCSKCLGCCDCAVKTKLPQLARRVYIHASPRGHQNSSTAVETGPNTMTFGPVAWLAKAKQMSGYQNLNRIERAIPTYDTIGGVFAADAATYLHNKLAARIPPSAGPRKTALSERSIFVQRSTATPLQKPAPRDGQGSVVQLAMLIRDDATPPSLVEWASSCTLTLPTAELAREITFASANGQQMMTSDEGNQCNWTRPVATNIPDSRSATCAGRLAALNLTYFLGNQVC